MVDVKQEVKGEAQAKVEQVEDDLRIVIDTVEAVNSKNTSSKADNIQRGVNDARKVLDLAVAIWRIVSLFKRKK